MTTSKAFVGASAINIKPYRSGTLDKLTFAAKDLIDLAGYKTGCGNPSWEQTHSPAAAHAICIEQLLYAGATCIGKTMTDELAFSLLGENFFYGTPVNPKAPDRVPGGSSSGSASAVACGLVDFALGTDTGGSVRVPASNCGIWGYRPSHGRISLTGVMPLVPSLDTLGVFAKNNTILNAVAAVLLNEDLVQQDLEPSSIYLLEDLFSICDPEICAALGSIINKLCPNKTNLSSVLTQALDYQGLFELFCQTQWPEIWNSHGAWITATAPVFGPATAKNFELTKMADRTHIPIYLKQRELFSSQINTFLGKHKLFCFPTTPILAPLLNSISTDRMQGDYYPRTLAMTAIAGLAGLPQVTLPLADVAGIPIGLSLVAARGNDNYLLSVAQKLFFKQQG